jgi:DNA invertase Pin-like site-specific DNA recombinase
LTKERVTAGLAAARRRGRVGGRPPAITGEKLESILAALSGGMSLAYYLFRILWAPPVGGQKGVRTAI